MDIAELVEIGGRIASGVQVPAIVDADQGGETALNVYRNVGAYVRAGISGFHIEDTRNPKHRGQGKSELMAQGEMVDRIAAAVEGRSDPDFLIIARSDCMIHSKNLGPFGDQPLLGLSRSSSLAQTVVPKRSWFSLPQARDELCLRTRRPLKIAL